MDYTYWQRYLAFLLPMNLEVSGNTLSPRPSPPSGGEGEDFGARFNTPKEFCHSAQGCAERATLGWPFKIPTHFRAKRGEPREHH